VAPARHRAQARRLLGAVLAVLAVLVVLAVGLSGLAPASAQAAATTALTTAAPPGTPVLVTSQTKPPKGFRLTARQVLAQARRSPTVIAELRNHPHLVPYEYTKGIGTWQVSWFTPPGKTPQKEMIQVYVSDLTGQVTQAWTGYQVQWTMARGYPGAFGRRVNALYVWIPLCIAFLLPFVPWRRRPSLLHLDLLVLLAFSASLAFFNNANLGMSVPLVYPCLVYLLVRMLLLAAGRGRPREPLRLLVPTSWLAIALVFLVGFRIGLNVTNSNVIDVGYAGVIGANKILYGDKLYGHFPSDNPQGDTYGPVNYDAYVPFNVIFGWSGGWDDLPAAHAAAITFDLLTLLGLFLLGRMIRGPSLGIVLAYAWAAYPFTLFALSSNSNDTLVPLLVVTALLVIRWAPTRGVVGAAAGLTKFAPLALAPLLMRGVGPMPPLRSLWKFVLAYGLTLLALMAYVIVTGNLSAFWHDTISYQAGRPAPFSIWGLWGGLGPVQHLLQGAAVALGVIAFFLPRRRGLVEVTALGAAIIIALQMGITYWFYLYIPWFFPLVIVATFGAQPSAVAEAVAESAPEPLRLRGGTQPQPA
jgi:hypothetical protein